MRYQDCSIEELKTFVADRRLVLPADTDPRRRARARRSYIHALEVADREQKFHRFMDLPPEMRNHVYSLLVNAEIIATWQPQIFKVSKQVHNEATGLAYKDNTFEIQVDAHRVRAQGVECGSYTPSISWKRNLDLLQWPRFLLKVVRLEIKFDEFKYNRNSDRPRSGGTLFNNVLYSLCTHLAETQKLKILHLDLPLGDENNKIRLDHIRSLCYLLRLLSSLTSIEIHGVDPAIIEAIKKDINGAQPHATVLTESKSIITKVETCCRLLRNAADRLQNCMRMVTYEKRGVYDKVMDGEWEKDVLKQVARMEDFLSALDLDHLSSLTKSQEKKSLLHREHLNEES